MFLRIFRLKPTDGFYTISKRKYFETIFSIQQGQKSEFNEKKIDFLLYSTNERAKKYFIEN